jgi:hypothetical protein
MKRILGSEESTHVLYCNPRSQPWIFVDRVDGDEPGRLRPKKILVPYDMSSGGTYYYYETHWSSDYIVPILAEQGLVLMSMTQMIAMFNHTTQNFPLTTSYSTPTDLQYILPF